MYGINLLQYFENTAVLNCQTYSVRETYRPGLRKERWWMIRDCGVRVEGLMAVVRVEQRCFCSFWSRPYTCHRRDDVQKSIRPGHLSSAINLHQTTNTPRHRRLAYILKRDKLNVWSFPTPLFPPSAPPSQPPARPLVRYYHGYTCFLFHLSPSVTHSPEGLSVGLESTLPQTTHPTCIKSP